MKAILIAPMENANAVLPPMDGDDLHLTYLVDGVRTGGFGMVGNVPGPAPIHSCYVLVHTSQATVDAMIASGDYLFIEEVTEPEIEALAQPPGRGPTHALKGRAAVVQWLRNHGYSPALLNAKIPPGAPAHGVRRGLQEIHGVSEVEYERVYH